MLLLLVLALATAGHLNASLITYNSRAAFDKAAPGLPVEDFASLNPGDGKIRLCDSPLLNSSCGGMLLPGISYSSPATSGGIEIAGPNSVGDLNLVAAFSNYAEDFVLALSAEAIGFNLYSYGPSIIDVRIISPTASTNFQIAAGLGNVFFGAIDTSDINSVILSSESGQYVGLGGVAFGQAAAAPEPNNLLLMGTA
jgi:hypothetical protein